jgi:hypothetical protein
VVCNPSRNDPGSWLPRVLGSSGRWRRPGKEVGQRWMSEAELETARLCGEPPLLSGAAVAAWRHCRRRCGEPPPLPGVIAVGARGGRGPQSELLCAREGERAVELFPTAPLLRPALATGSASGSWRASISDATMAGLDLGCGGLGFRRPRSAEISGSPAAAGSSERGGRELARASTPSSMWSRGVDGRHALLVCQRGEREGGGGGHRRRCSREEGREAGEREGGGGRLGKEVAGRTGVLEWAVGRQKRERIPGKRHGTAPTAKCSRRSSDCWRRHSALSFCKMQMQ